MAEKINLVEFDINVTKLIERAQDTKQRLDEIKQEMREMTKAGKGASEAYINNAVSLKTLNSEYAAQLKVLSDVNNATGKAIPLEQKLDSILQSEATTIAALRKQNSDLRKIRNETNITTEEGRKQIELMNAQMDKNDALIKEQVSDLEQQKIGIGGYADGIKEALGGTTLFGGAINDVNTAFKQLKPITDAFKSDINETSESIKNITAGTQGLTTAKKASTIATNAFSASLKVLRLALISTGIGAILVAFGSLVAYLTTTSEGVDRLNRVLTPLKTTFTAMLGVLQDLGKVLVDVFTNPLDSAKALLNFVKNQMVVQFRSLGQMLLGILTFDVDLIKQGFNELAENVKGHIEAVGGYFGEVGDRMSDAWGVGKEIAALTEQIKESELELTRNQARLNREISEHREIARDISRSQSERNKAAQTAIEYAKELRDLELGHQQLIVERLRLQQSVSQSSHEDNKELAEQEAELNEIEARHARRMTEHNEALNSSRNAGIRDQKKALDDRIKGLNEELELFQAQQSTQARTAEEEIQLAQEVANRRIAILDAELETKKISQTKYNTEVLKIQNELANAQVEATLEAGQRDLELMENRFQTEMALSRTFGEERLKLELEQAQKLSEARANYETQRYLQGQIAEQEYQDNLLKIRQQRDITEAEIERERAQLMREQRFEQLDMDLAMEMAALEERNAGIWEIEAAAIEQQRERELEAARMRYQDKALLAQAELLINKQAENARVKLAIDHDKAIWQSRASLLESLGTIFGEQTALGKTAGIAQATVNAYVGMTEALKLPWPFNLAAAASTLAAGMRSVRQITSVDASINKPSIPGMRSNAMPEVAVENLNAIPPFAQGGLVTGGFPIKRSNGDNVLATLKKGEVVLTEQHQMMLGGSNVFKSLGVPGFANGGVAGGSTATLQRSILSGIDETMAKTIGDAVMRGSRQGTQQGSRQGIVDASTERFLDNLSTF